ncbi:hypothetical protein D3C71_1746670 [compost metagenome]
MAMNLESSSEMNEPPKPKMAAKTSRPLIWLGLTPSTDITMPARISTAKLVSRKRAMRLNMGKGRSWEVDECKSAVTSA